MKFSRSTQRFSFKAFLRRYSSIIYPALKLLFVVVVITGIYSFFKDTDYFKVESIEFSGVFKFVNENDFKSMVNNRLLGKRMYDVNRAGVEADLLTNFQGIATVRVNIVYPDRVKIDVTERKPIALVIDESKERYLLDNEGYVLGIAEPVFYDLPTVAYSKKIYVGQFLDKNIIPVALEILGKAKDSKVAVTSLSFEPDFVTFNTWENILVYLSTKKDIGLSFGVIAELIKKSQEMDKKPIQIDLRYNKVIVLYE